MESVSLRPFPFCTAQKQGMDTGEKILSIYRLFLR